MTAPKSNSSKQTAPDRAALRSVRRVVIKIGTSLLTGGGTHIDERYLGRVVRTVARLWDEGRQVAIVTSGSIGAGCGQLGFDRPPKSLPDRQACAAVGQCQLMKLYAQAFKRQRTYTKRAVGQLLLTRDGLENRQRYLNARHTLEALFERGAVPIINENDTVSVDEIRFGDNDTLSALVAVAAEAELLIILSDVPGLMDAPPRDNPQAKMIATVPDITPEIERLASPIGSYLGTGGMVSKLEAAKIVTGAGESMVLVGGHKPDILAQVLDGAAVGTFFPAKGDRLAARKRWLAFSPRPQGTLVVDAGAREALVKRGKSLLPSGIVQVKGRFEPGALVALAGPDGRPFARGLSNFSGDEVEQIRGMKTRQAEKKLGQLLFSEVVHRDNMVVLDGEKK